MRHNSYKKISFDNFDSWIIYRVIIFIFFTSNIYIKGCWMVNETTSFSDVRTEKNCFIYFFLFLIRFFRRNIDLANMFSIVNGIVSTWYVRLSYPVQIKGMNISTDDNYSCYTVCLRKCVRMIRMNPMVTGIFFITSIRRD